MPSITINGTRCEAQIGMTVLEVAREAGIRIPTLCYLKDTSAVGSCRMCVVEVEGADCPVPACTTVVREGMGVKTESLRLTEYRRMALELLLANHGTGSLDDCLASESDGRCELQALCREYGVLGAASCMSRHLNGSGAIKGVAAVKSNPFLSYDPCRCILCQRCVGACNTAARNHTLRAGKRGVRSSIEAPFGEDWHDTACESCGNCAQACPTGALSMKRRAGYHAGQTNAVRTTCPHCGVGCQIDLITEDNRVVDAVGAPGPSNKEILCVKGRSASFDFVHASDRLRTPLVKNRITGTFEPATWDEALDVVAARLGDLRDEYGGESLAAFACSRSTNEDVYLFQKMARTALKTNNVDCCARV